MAIIKCSSCGAEHTAQTLEKALYVCPVCQTHLYMPARARVAMLADPRSFKELDRGLISVDPLRFTDQRSYRERLAEARQKTGLREAVVIGEARIEGRRVMLIVFDFEFMGGTMGSVVGEKVADAFEFATKRRLAVVSVAASGGARMQEGMLSLMQMAKTAAARAAHDRAGLAYLSILTNPTFGGVAASFASLGDVIIAEPGALIGFVGPRVIGMTMGEKVPPESHRAEFLYRAGMVDLIVPRPELRDAAAYLVGHLGQDARARRSRLRAPRGAVKRRPLPEPAATWQTVQLARHPGRPTSMDYVSRLFARFVELHGDRHYGDDPAVMCGLGEFEDETVVVIAQERGRNEQEQEVRHHGMAYPEGYRKALRVMHLAAKFGLPVVTLIDTPGAYPGVEAEQRGIAQALATNLAAMSVLPTPVVSVVLGEGGSGGALSLGVADRVLMLEHAIYSVISPEGAAAILWRDASKAAQVAEALKITAGDLLRLGIIDGIVPEPAGGAHLDHDRAVRLLHDALAAALRGLRGQPLEMLLRRRYQKYRHIGRVGVYWRQVVRAEMQEVLERLEQRVLRREGDTEPAAPRPERREEEDAPSRKGVSNPEGR